MRITPDHPRLRIVAIACWAFGAWLFMQLPLLFQASQQVLLSLAAILAAALCFAVGISFWLLGTDRRAGVVFDAKGMMLNLGHSAAFVGWDNIVEVGVSDQRQNLLTLGSRAQLGIRLRDPEAYLQSYEMRLPAARGLLARLLRLVQRSLTPFKAQECMPTCADLVHLRRVTGYDLLIPEALLGGRAVAFRELIELYRRSPHERQTLQTSRYARA